MDKKDVYWFHGSKIIIIGLCIILLVNIYYRNLYAMVIATFGMFLVNSVLLLYSDYRLTISKREILETGLKLQEQSKKLENMYYK
jgi:hypothetical protein